MTEIVPTTAPKNNPLWILTGLAIIVTTLYFYLKSKQASQIKQRAKEKRLLSPNEIVEEVKENAPEISEAEERAIQRNQLEAIHSIMKENDELKTSLEGLEDQMKLYQ